MTATDLEKFLDNLPDVCEHWDTENGVCIDCGEYINKRREYEKHDDDY